MGRQEIKPLTGIRGVAAMLVAVYHLNGPHAAAALQVPGVAGAVVGHGYLAVDLFFVLSGYVMALSYAEMVRRFEWRSYVRFLIRRIARVYPLYIALTVAIALALALGISRETLGARLGPTLFWNALMVQSWWGAGISIDNPAWSISAEWAAYVLFPLLAALALFGSRRTACCLFLAAVAGVAAITAVPLHEPARSGPLDIYAAGFTVVRCLGEFSLGLLAYRVGTHDGARAVASQWWAALAIAACLVALMAGGGTDLAVAALFPPLVLALAVGKGPVQRFCAWTPIFFLGELSYAVYLLHTRLMRVRDVLEPKLHGVLGAAAPAAASLVVYALLLLGAWALYRGLERPARAWVRKAERLIPSRIPAGDVSPLPGAAGP